MFSISNTPLFLFLFLIIISSCNSINFPSNRLNNDYSNFSSEFPNQSAHSIDYIEDILGLNSLYQRESEKNLTVAILDTGINISHPVFTNLEINKTFYWTDIRFYTQGSGSYSPIDIDGHGTHTASIIYRLNPMLSVYAINVFNNVSGTASTSLQNITFAIEHAANITGNNQPDIISLSLGSSSNGNTYDSAALAVDACQSKDILVVSSAGNSGLWGKGNVYTPGISNWSITVGGMESLNKRDPKSSVGPVFNKRIKPDLIAPSIDIEGADHKNGQYKSLSGTSQSAAIISGLVSLLKSRFYDLNATELKKLLYISSVKLPFPESQGEFCFPDNYQGFGIPQEDAFVQMMEQLSPVEFPQKITLNSTLGEGTTWIRKVQFEKGKIYGWNLKWNPNIPKTKMIIYSDRADEFGYPKILRTSDDFTRTLSFASDRDQIVWFAVKMDLSTPNRQYLIEIVPLPQETFFYQIPVAIFITIIYLLGIFMYIRKRIE